VVPKQKKMLETLRTLKDKGIILFVVSNSHVEYIEAIMDHAFGKEWKELFCIVCAKAGKQGFFLDPTRNFLKYDPSTSTRAGASIDQLEYEKHHIVLEGNAQTLEVLIKYAGQREGRILFYGDSYVTDCLSSQKNKNWDAICIMEELDNVDFGPGYDKSIWGEWNVDEYEGKKVDAFWYSYMKENCAKIVSACDSKDLDSFYFGK